jgi:HSP20 family protein
MTNITRYDPFQNVLSLREAMNQLLEESFVRPGLAQGGQSFAPALDVSETEDAYRVEAAVPGLKAEDLDVTLENGMLTIRGEIKQEQDEQQRNYHRIERRFGAFSRSITFPTQVKADAVEAHLEHGVLHLVIPKAEEVKPRKISVAVNAN